MLKILKPKIIFVNWKFKITLNNNVMKNIRAVCKKRLLYSQQYLQETDFLNGDGDNDSNGKVAESCSNDGVDVDDVDVVMEKRKLIVRVKRMMMMVIMIKLIVMMMQMVVVEIGRIMEMRMVFLRNGMLMGKVVMRPMMVMSKLRVLQEALLNVVEVLKWKWQWEKCNEQL